MFGCGLFGCGLCLVVGYVWLWVVIVICGYEGCTLPTREEKGQS